MRCCYLFVAIIAATPALAQQRPITSADYARAERYLAYNTTPLVFGIGGRASWLPDERLWYRNVTPNGVEFVVVDPARETRTNLLTDPAPAGAIASASPSQPSDRRQ